MQVTEFVTFSYLLKLAIPCNDPRIPTHTGTANL